MISVGIVRKIVKTLRKKEFIPIQHTTDATGMLEDKVALIIGGSGGIGKAIAKSFSESGCKVIICVTRQQKLEKCLSSFENKDNVRTMIFNVANPETFEERIDEATSFWGKIDILVNSAGVHTENVDFFDMKPEEFDRVMNIDLKGAFFVCQAIGKYMIDNNIKGSILNISSSRGSEPAWSPYGLSKWGLKGLTMGVGKIFSPYGINVNAIAPGSTATSLLGIEDGDSINSNENYMGRLIMPDEVASLAKLIVSDVGKMIDGEVIHIAAGRGTFEFR